MSAPVTGVRVHRPPHHGCAVDYPQGRDYLLDEETGCLHVQRENDDTFATFADNAWVSVELLNGESE